MLMRLLHLLPPEAAHALTLQALLIDMGPRLKVRRNLSTILFGKLLRNPIGLSAGADKEAVALRGWSKMGFGLVEAGTVTLKARTGNPAPRIWRMPGHALVNWLGLPGHGLENFVRNLAAFQNDPARKELCVGASIASPDGILDEFKIIAASVAPYVDYITLNASCPNVAHADHALEETAAAHIRKTREGAGRVPVLVKLGPTHDATVLDRMVMACLNAGVDGFVATNTVPYTSRDILGNINFDWPSVPKGGDGRPPQNNMSLRERSAQTSSAAYERTKVGGYSGPQLLDISTWMVREIRKRVGDDMPILGVGGIQSGQDAKRMLISGANAIQLYTGLVYHGPDLLNDIAESL